MPIVMVHLMGRKGTEPNLSIKWSVSIDTMINFDGDGDKDGETSHPLAGYVRYGQQVVGTHPTGCDIIIHCLSNHDVTSVAVLRGKNGAPMEILDPPLLVTVVLHYVYSLYIWRLFVFAAGIGIWNPAFDVTPAALITGGIVTEFGVFSPEELRTKLQEHLNK